MIKMVWIVTTITASGPVTLNVPETTVFKDRTACTRFADDMTGRMQDWVRGAFRADWNHPVQIRFRCEPAGDPV